MRIWFAGVLLVLGLLAAGCSSGPGRSPAIGEAYAGPMTLVLRQDINPSSAGTGTVHHGQRLEILSQAPAASLAAYLNVLVSDPII